MQGIEKDNFLICLRFQARSMSLNICFSNSIVHYLFIYVTFSFRPSFAYVIIASLSPANSVGEKANKRLSATMPSSTNSLRQHLWAHQMIAPRSIHPKYIKRLAVCLPWIGGIRSRIETYGSNARQKQRVTCTIEQEFSFFYFGLPPSLFQTFNQNICRDSV